MQNVMWRKNTTACNPEHKTPTVKHGGLDAVLLQGKGKLVRVDKKMDGAK